MTDRPALSYRSYLLTCSIATIAVGILGLFLSLAAVTGHDIVLNTNTLIPLAGLHLQLGPLSALFDIITSVIALPVGIAMLPYFSHHQAPRLTLALLPIFVGAMLAVPMAATYFDFWFFWELMALTSAALVLAHYRDSTTRHAGIYYIAYTQVGFALILVSTASLCTSPTTPLLENSQAHLLPLSSLVFVLSLLGFSSKAGLLPLNSWLPLAHPEAPTPVSALMSAAMVNLGIYGIIRIDLVGTGQIWWGVLMIFIGVATTTHSALHALVSPDIKKLLAYSTSENLGIIIIALGVYELARSTDLQVIAEVALAAALLHLIGHALFKSLAFLSAGQLIDVAGTRDVDQMGGMVHRSPFASLGFGIASLGATGLPLGAGFIGEWLLLQALIHTPSNAPTLLRVVMPITVAFLALTVGLKVAAFTKSFGIGILSRARTAYTQPTLRRPAMRVIEIVVISLLVLANLCFATLPNLVASLYRPIARSLIPREPFIHLGLTVSLLPLKGAVSPLAIMIEVVCFTLAVLIIVETRIRSNGRVHDADLWNCGGSEPRIRMQYNSTSFAQPLETIFGTMLRLRESTTTDHADPNQLIIATVAYERSRADVVATTLEHYTTRIVSACATFIRRAHRGNMRLYILYGAIGLLLLLVVARW